MNGETLVRETLCRLLAEVDSETGNTKWEALKEVMQREANSGDARYAKLLLKAKVIERKNPEFVRKATGDGA